MLPTPTGVGGPKRGETHKVSLPPGPCTFTCLATSFKEVVRLQGHKTTAISKQLGEYFDLAHPYRGRAGQAEYLGNTHPSENAQPGKERQPMWSQPVHDPHKNTRVPAPPKGTQGLGHYFVLAQTSCKTPGRAGQSSVLEMPRYQSICISKNRLP